jgi:archaellum component FlaC
MIGREVIMREIERIEGRLKVLETMLGRPGSTANDFKNEISNIEDKIGNLKSMVAREPFSGHEINVKGNR